MGNACSMQSGTMYGREERKLVSTFSRISLTTKRISPKIRTVISAPANSLNMSCPVKVDKLVLVAVNQKNKAKELSEKGRRLSEIIGQERQNNGGIISELSMRDKEIIARCWRKHVTEGRPDLFHKTMLHCIEASPKLNEIIACGRYCYRDLRRWPKLNKICQAQFKFFERLIYELNMDERRMREACQRLGQTHAEYARFGLKPHFLDIFQQQLLVLVSKLDYESQEEREESILAFTRFSSFIIDVMIRAYGDKLAERRERTKARENEPPSE